MERYDWIIGVCNTGADGVILYRFYGSKDDVKQKLLSLINYDRRNDEGGWDFGCECLEDIVVEDNGSGYELYGYGCYYDYHIDYSAKEFSRIENLHL